MKQFVKKKVVKLVHDTRAPRPVKRRVLTPEEQMAYICLTDDVGCPEALLRLPVEDGESKEKAIKDALDLAQELFEVIVGDTQYDVQPTRAELYCRWHRAVEAALDATLIPRSGWFCLHNWGNDVAFWVYLIGPNEDKREEAHEALGLDPDKLYCEGKYAEYERVVEWMADRGALPLPHVGLSE